MSRLDHAAVAAALLNVYKAATPMPPLTDTYPDLTVDDAYRIQRLQIEQRLGGGQRLIGYKIGLTSLAMQEQLGVDQPDYGSLLSTMAFPADAPISTSAFLQPRAEPEIALVLRSPLRGPGVGVADVIRATDFVLPAIEIIDSRIADWRIGLADTIADNASSGGIVLGSTRRSLDGLDLTVAGCVLRRNGRIAATGTGGAVLGNPLNAAAWLVNRLGDHGVELQPGHIVLTGSITAAIPVNAGDTVSAAIDRLGTVTAVFD